VWIVWLYFKYGMLFSRMNGFITVQSQWTPLMNAAEQGQLDLVMWLCDMKADVLSKSEVRMLCILYVLRLLG